MRISVYRRRIVALVTCCALVAGPFFAVQFPPITDLPQQVAQIRLFLDAMSNPDSAYRVQWLTPYSLSYGLLGAAWALCAPLDAGRMAMAGLAVLWTAAVHLLAARRGRSIAAAILASLLFYNPGVYWGFLSFAVGWLVFAVWFLITTAPPRERFGAGDATRYCAAALLLYMGHALWLLAGLGWLVLHALLHRRPLPELVRRLASTAPVLVLAAVWYPQLAAQGFVSPTVWFDPPWSRVSPTWLVDAALGGLRGASEPLVCALLLAWVVAGLWQRRAAIDVDCLAAALLFWLMALLLPDQHMNTIQFAARWLPAGVMMLILAVPAPALPMRRPWLPALALLAVFSLTTAMAWRRFNSEELTGLETLAALPEQPRVIALDFAKESAIVKGRPFMQLFAYAQVLRGGSLHMTFAGHATSLVVFKQRPPMPWTPQLVWFAERVKRSDFATFDHAIIHGGDAIHSQSANLQLQPLTSTGRWRLYRVPGAAP